MLNQSNRGSARRALHIPSKYILLSLLFGVAWIGSVACGFAVFARYDNTPGRVGVVPSSWPSPGVELDRHRPTLVMVAHPRCPCTRASLGELAQIMAQAQGKLTAYVLFVKPVNGDGGWSDTDLWRSARQIPGVTVLEDIGGAVATKLGAATSGHTLVYAPDGRLLFNGGITESRGHAGDNVGESSIVALATGHSASRNQTPVFGCALVNPARVENSAKCPR